MKDNNEKRGKRKRFDMGPISDDQMSAAREILAKYDLKNLSKDTAKEIFGALEDEGIHGPGAFELIKEAGGDPIDLFDKAMDGKKMPPPPHGWRGRHRPSETSA